MIPAVALTRCGPPLSTTCRHHVWLPDPDRVGESLTVEARDTVNPVPSRDSILVTDADIVRLAEGFCRQVERSPESTSGVPSGHRHVQS